MTTLTQGVQTCEWLISTAPGQRSYSKGTATVSATTALPSGTLMGKVTASGKYIASAVGATDGSETPAAIAIYGADATSADVTVSAIVRDAEVNGNCLTYHADRDQPAEKSDANAALATLSVIVR